MTGKCKIFPTSVNHSIENERARERERERESDTERERERKREFSRLANFQKVIRNFERESNRERDGGGGGWGGGALAVTPQVRTREASLDSAAPAIILSIGLSDLSSSSVLP